MCQSNRTAGWAQPAAPSPEILRSIFWGIENEQRKAKTWNSGLPQLLLGILREGEFFPQQSREIGVK